jgi:hypothetical protein
MSNRVADIASALADGSDQSPFGQKSIFVTLTQSIGRTRRGYLDFIGGRPPRQWTNRLSSSSSLYAKAFTQGKDLNTVIFDRIDLVKMTYVKIRHWFYMVTTVHLDRQLRLSNSSSWHATVFTQSRDLKSSGATGGERKRTQATSGGERRTSVTQGLKALERGREIGSRKVL